MPAKRFEDLIVWQKAHQFVLGVYRLSQTFPRSETYGLSSVASHRMPVVRFLVVSCQGIREFSEHLDPCHFRVFRFSISPCSHPSSPLGGED